MAQRLSHAMSDPWATAIGANPLWWRIVWEAWAASIRHDTAESECQYDLADSYLNGHRLNGSLSVLRHNVGSGHGTVSPVPATETAVVSLFLKPNTPALELRDRHRAVTSIPEDRIAAFIENMDAGFHLENIGEPRPHVMVLSTGRCGTMSLHRLFSDSNLMPYHTYWFMVHPQDRWEMVCRLDACNFDDMAVPSLWASTRAAEWLGEKPMIGVNHTDTIFAPVFAAVHPRARFVYLRREPEDVFNSFIRKDQWSGGTGHFRPVAYDFVDGKFEYNLADVTDEDGVKHHIQFTEEFSRAFGRVMGDRFIEISSDKLFNRDREEISRLLEFTGSDIDVDFAVEHFSKKINEKAHKCLS